MCNAGRMRLRWSIFVVGACSSSAAPPVQPAVPPPVVAVDASTPLVAAPRAPSCNDDRLAPTDYGDADWDATVERRATSKDACAVADSNLVKLEAAIANAQPGRSLTSAGWNHRTAPKFLDLVQRRFELHGDELASIKKNGFAVLGRLEVPSYTFGYHEIFQSQLPVYITADSIFQAIFASHDTIVEQLESSRLSPELEQTFSDLSCGLGAAAADYPADTARDLDLYTLVGRKLLAGNPMHSAFNDAAIEHDADELVALITAGTEIKVVTIFGRKRMIDFTAYRPRGHYAADESQQRYFRAAMWASRLEFNLVSRSSRSSAPGPEPDPTETPREAIDALALADLAGRSTAATHVAEMDHAWEILAGKREDVSIEQLAELRKQVGSLVAADAYTKLKAAIGDRFQRTTRIHPMPEGSRVLPAIATLIGPRIVVDATALMPLVHSAIPGRDWATISDIAYTMGLDRAKTYLASDLSQYGSLGDALATSRGTFSKLTPGDDLYSAWLVAIRNLATPIPGTPPSFLATDAAADLRLDSIAAAYGQLKHNYVLIAGQPYAEFGCEIPDGYVEPVPAVYKALIEYARRGERLAELLEHDKRHPVTAYFRRTGAVLSILAKITNDELANRALTTEQRRWLGMVAELEVNLGVDTTGHPPMYTGWFFDLFYSREGDGMKSGRFTADYFTGQQGVAYVGATAPRLGVFVVDSSGEPRAFVGPVAHAYEARGPIGTRFTDESPPTTKLEPWAASYALAAAAEPELSVKFEDKQLVFESATTLGKATVKLLDHHRVPFKTLHLTIAAGNTPLAINRSGVSAIYLEVGSFRDFVVENSYGEIAAHWGKPPPED